MIKLEGGQDLYVTSQDDVVFVRDIDSPNNGSYSIIFPAMPFYVDGVRYDRDRSFENVYSNRMISFKPDARSTTAPAWDSPYVCMYGFKPDLDEFTRTGAVVSEDGLEPCYSCWDIHGDHEACNDVEESLWLDE